MKEWKVNARSSLFKKYGRGIDEVWFELPDGRVDEFYVKDEPETVCVLPITTDGDVVLARQFRPGPCKLLHELPGGGVSDGESAKDAVERELIEETGYAGTVRLVTTFHDCGYSTRLKNCFVATDCRRVQDPSLDQNEFIEPAIVSFGQFLSYLRSGSLTDVAAAYAAIDYLIGRGELAPEILWPGFLAIQSG